MLAAAVMFLYRFRTQVENFVIGEGRFGLEALSNDSVRFIAKRLAGLLKYQYQMGHQGLSPDLIEVQIVDQLYSHILSYFIENGLVEPSFLSSKEVILFYSDKPEMFILPNGSLFLSESLLTKLLGSGDDQVALESLAYLLTKDLSHIVRGHLR